MGNVVLEEVVVNLHSVKRFSTCLLAICQSGGCGLFRCVHQRTHLHRFSGVKGQWALILFWSSDMSLFLSQDFIPDFPYEPDGYDEELLR